MKGKKSFVYPAAIGKAEHETFYYVKSYLQQVFPCNIHWLQSV